MEHCRKLYRFSSVKILCIGIEISQRNSSGNWMKISIQWLKSQLNISNLSDRLKIDYPKRYHMVCKERSRVGFSLFKSHSHNVYQKNESVSFETGDELKDTNIPKNIEIWRSKLYSFSWVDSIEKSKLIS